MKALQTLQTNPTATTNYQHFLECLCIGEALLAFYLAYQLYTKRNTPSEKPFPSPEEAQKRTQNTLTNPLFKFSDSLKPGRSSFFSGVVSTLPHSCRNNEAVSASSSSHCVQREDISSLLSSEQLSHCLSLSRHDECSFSYEEEEEVERSERRSLKKEMKAEVLPLHTLIAMRKWQRSLQEPSVDLQPLVLNCSNNSTFVLTMPLNDEPSLSNELTHDYNQQHENSPSSTPISTPSSTPAFTPKETPEGGSFLSEEESHLLETVGHPFEGEGHLLEGASRYESWEESQEESREKECVEEWMEEKGFMCDEMGEESYDEYLSEATSYRSEDERTMNEREWIEAERRNRVTANEYLPCEKFRPNTAEYSFLAAESTGGEKPKRMTTTEFLNRIDYNLAKIEAEYPRVRQFLEDKKREENARLKAVEEKKELFNNVVDEKQRVPEEVKGARQIIRHSFVTEAPVGVERVKKEEVKEVVRERETKIPSRFQRKELKENGNGEVAGYMLSKVKKQRSGSLESGSTHEGKTQYKTSCVFYPKERKASPNTTLDSAFVARKAPVPVRKVAKPLPRWK